MVVKRRNFLQGLGIGAASLGVATPGRAAAPDERPPLRHETLVIDVAVLGHTNYSDPTGAANRARNWQEFRQSDSRGTQYYFEGLVYPGGTIPDPAPEDPDGVVWDFKVEPLGTFFDRGWILINHKSDGPYIPRPHPHLLAHTDYYLGGVVNADNLTPTDMIQVVGMENGIPPNDIVVRAVTGGTGRYATVRGQVAQQRVGRNASGIRGMPGPQDFLPKSPNYRLTFDLWL